MIGQLPFFNNVISDRIALLSAMFTFSSSEHLHDMLGDLFLPVETPDAPSKGFFKGLFGGGGGALDREELCEW